MCTLGQETDSLAPHNPPQKNYFCTAAILTLTQSRRIPFEGRAPTDSAIRAPGTITCHSSRHEQFPRGSFLPLFKPFCQLKRHKRLCALPSSLYKSLAEEDSRHSDILKPRFTGVIYSEAVLKKKKKWALQRDYSSRHEFFQDRDDSSDPKAIWHRAKKYSKWCHF